MRRVDLGSPVRPATLAPAHQAAWGLRDASGLGVGELIGMLWRERILILAVGAAVFALGLVAVMKLPRLYTAQSRVLVLYDDAYLYRSVVGDAQPRNLLPPEQVIRAETNFLEADELKRRVIDRVGLDKIYPDLARGAEGADEAELAQIEGVAVRALASGYKVQLEPNSPAMSLQFRHDDAETASLVANAILDEYLAYRREVLVGSPPEGLAEERRKAEIRLTSISSDVEALLSANSIGDFDADRRAAQDQSAYLARQLLDVRSRRQEIASRLIALDKRLVETPSTIKLSVEDGSAERLQALSVEREELLAGYQSDAAPVREIDRRITRLQQSIRGGKLPEGRTSRGPNPLHQQLTAEKAQLEVESASIVTREATLAAQLDGVRAVQLKFQELAPEYERLLRERDALGSTVRRFLEREEQGRALRALAQQSIDNIRIVERAAKPMEASSMRKPAGVVALALAGLAALTAGLARAFVRRAAEGSPAPLGRGGQAEGAQFGWFDEPPTRPRRRRGPAGRSGVTAQGQAGTPASGSDGRAPTSEARRARARATARRRSADEVAPAALAAPSHRRETVSAISLPQGVRGRSRRALWLAEATRRHFPQ